MQTLIAHSAFWRGLSLFAGMLVERLWRETRQQEGSSVRGNVTATGELVSWCSTARSRREDEMERFRQSGKD